jgi:hypothetical protein
LLIAFVTVCTGAEIVPAFASLPLVATNTALLGTAYEVLPTAADPVPVEPVVVAPPPEAGGLLVGELVGELVGLLVGTLPAEPSAVAEMDVVTSVTAVVLEIADSPPAPTAPAVVIRLAAVSETDACQPGSVVPVG